MATNTVVLTGDKELRKLLRKWGVQGAKELSREVKTTLTSIENSYRRGVKDNYGEGDLSRSIKTETKDDWKSGETGSDVEQALHIEFGTKDHFVKPKNKKALSWIDPSSGERRISKGHKVKGIKGNHALLKAWIDRMGASSSKFVKRMKQRMERFK